MKNECLVKIENLYKSYEKHDRFKTHKKEVLAGININIQKDEIFGLVGESGCGKSTICNLILGLDKCDSGKIIFDNADITNMKEKDMRPIRKNLQAVFQDSKSSLNPKMKVYDILNKLDLDHLRNRNPRDLSGGEKQRVAIACTLVTNPNIVILDEPTRGMDALAKENLGLIIENLKEEGKSIIIITHDSDFLGNYADSVMLMFDGEIVANGQALEILCDSLYYSPQISKVFKDKCKVINSKKAIELLMER